MNNTPIVLVLTWNYYKSCVWKNILRRNTIYQKNVYLARHFYFGNDRLLSLTKSKPYVMIYKIICLRRQQRIRKIFAQHTKQLNHQQHVVYNQKTTSALMINGH